MSPQAASAQDEALRNLFRNYDELNSATIVEVDEITPLDFMRHVARNEPVIIRRAAKDWSAFKKWDAEYLRQKMGKETVNVALTPHGMADSVYEKNGKRMYVEPLERAMPFDEVLTYIQAQEKTRPDPGVPIMYAQTQNDNMRNEYNELSHDVLPGIDFARIALQQPEPDAVNFWLGNSRSVTSIHRDNYENVFAQIRGSKRFLLLPPIATACMQEQDCQRARFVATNTPNTTDVRDLLLEPCVAEPMTSTPIPTWDPDEDPALPRSLASLITPRIADVREGDMLYLPALWYHKVTQTAGPEDFCCSVNYWYDMNHSGPFWSMTNFIRDVARYGSSVKRP